MRHLWPELRGSDAGSPAGGTQSNGCPPVPPSAGTGEPIFPTSAVLAGLFGVMTSAGLPAQTSTSRLSENGKTQAESAAFRRVVIWMALCCPGSALSGPEVGPVRLTSGLSHHVPLPLWAPPSPETASMKMQVSALRPGSLGMNDSFEL